MSSSKALRIKYSDPVDPWEMLKTPWGEMPAWKAATYATGAADSAISAYEQVRNDSAHIVARQDAREASLKARADAISERERKVAVDAAVVTELMGRVGKAIDWLEKQKADQEREPEEPLEILPEEWRSKEPVPPQSLEDAAPGEPSKEELKEDQDSPW